MRVSLKSSHRIPIYTLAWLVLHHTEIVPFHKQKGCWIQIERYSMITHLRGSTAHHWIASTRILVFLSNLELATDAWQFDTEIKWPHIVPDWHHILHPKFMISCFCHVSARKIKLSSKTFSSRFWLSCHRTWQGEHWNGIKNFGVSGSLQYLCMDNYTVYMGFTYLAIQEEDGDYMCRTAQVWTMPQVDRRRNWS